GRRLHSARRRGAHAGRQPRQRSVTPPETCADRDGGLERDRSAVVRRRPACRVGQLRRCGQPGAAARLPGADAARRMGAGPACDPVRTGRERVGRDLPDRRWLRDAGARGLCRGEGAVLRRSAIWVVLFPFLLLGCGAPASVEDAVHPSIVSLNPCTDAVLAEVAEPEQLLALSHYSHDPRATSMPLAEARQFRVTGGTVEEVLALDPDIVVAGAFLPPAAMQAFERLGIRVETFEIAASFAENAAQIRRLARLADREERGEALVGRVGAALAATRHEGPPVAALLWQQGGIVPGERTLAARILAHTGFASHSAARGLGQGAYLPLEQVLVDPPEVVLAA